MNHVSDYDVILSLSSRASDQIRLLAHFAAQQSVLLPLSSPFSVQMTLKDMQYLLVFYAAHVIGV